MLAARRFEAKVKIRWVERWYFWDKIKTGDDRILENLPFNFGSDRLDG